jgi:glycosyltransferase involved in cell wall biosynthesis
MISVIIPSYNRADMLAKILPTYIATASIGEIIIVDDGSKDNTIEVVESFRQQDARIQLIVHPKNLGRTTARNHAIEQATGDLILNSEDDLLLPPGSLDALYEHMQLTNADLIAGRRIWMRFGETEAEALHRANAHLHPVMNRKLLDTDSQAITPTDVEIPLVNATMLVKREVFEKIHFQDCFAGNGWREDSDVQISALELGYKLIFCPHVIFFHLDRPQAGLGTNRFKSDLSYLYWIYRNDLTFLQRHKAYFKKEIPESLLFGSTRLSALRYVTRRSAWLLRSEVRRFWQSHSKH